MAGFRLAAKTGSSEGAKLEGLVRIGRVGRPHGTAGEFSVSDATERAGLLEPGREIWLGERATTITARKGTPERPLLEVEGVDDRETARKLSGTEILAPREVIGRLTPGEYLVDDLIGLEVMDAGTPIGFVSDVVMLPSVEAIEVDRGSAGTTLVPLVHDAVRSIDPERKRIDVDLTFLEETSAGS
jgi:16S rRNA processing protein RimM